MVESWLEFSKRSEWSDIQPLYIDNENIILINYTPKFKEIFGYLRAVIAKNEMSQRAFDLTTEGLELNPANYTIWIYRRTLLKELNKPLHEEFEYISNIIMDDSKNYQVWYHRLKLVEWTNDYSKEFEFINKILDEDSKNYHAWQHRQTILKMFDCFHTNTHDLNHSESQNVQLYNTFNQSPIFLSEMNFVDSLIEEDVLNNAAWNHRYFLLTHATLFDDSIINCEFDYVLIKIHLSFENESCWNYLKGLYNKSSSKTKEVIYTKILDLKNSLPENSLFVKSFLIEVCLEMENSDFHQTKLITANELCDQMIILDKLHKNYWTSLKINLNKLIDC